MIKFDCSGLIQKANDRKDALLRLEDLLKDMPEMEQKFTEVAEYCQKINVIRQEIIQLGDLQPVVGEELLNLITFSRLQEIQNCFRFENTGKSWGFVALAYYVRTGQRLLPGQKP